MYLAFIHTEHATDGDTLKQKVLKCFSTPMAHYEPAEQHQLFGIVSDVFGTPLEVSHETPFFQTIFLHLAFDDDDGVEHCLILYIKSPLRPSTGLGAGDYEHHFHTHQTI